MANNVQKKILLVEDDTVIIESLVTTFKKAGYDVLSAENGTLGIKTALETHPDLVVADLMLPDMDGTEMIEKLRNDPWGKQAKIIVLTNIDESQIRNKLVSLNVTEYLLKVTTPLTKLVEVVEKIVK